MATVAAKLPDSTVEVSCPEKLAGHLAVDQFTHQIPVHTKVASPQTMALHGTIWIYMVIYGNIWY